ncbi:MAG: hypothetical protein HC900_09135 [Methylacidiphilales bacterium]|nr:hypothetical protein [Candidatus Methylacidiphilales bacterium]
MVWRVWQARRLLTGAAGCGLMVLALTPAVAGGSLPFEEVMAAVAGTPVAAELEAIVKAERANPDELVCTGVRLGNQWSELGGMRVMPFECEIGKRTVTIDGTVQFLDAKGKVIATVTGGNDSQLTKQVFRKAQDVRMIKPSLTAE